MYTTGEGGGPLTRTRVLHPRRTRFRLSLDATRAAVAVVVAAAAADVLEVFCRLRQLLNMMKKASKLSYIISRAVVRDMIDQVYCS